MGQWRMLMAAALGLGLAAGAGGCLPVPFFLGNAPAPIPVPPWVSERLEEKLDKRYLERTPILPPIGPGGAPVFCMDPPTLDEAKRALPRLARGFPYVYEEFRDDYRMEVELLVDKIDPPTVFPLVGPAQLHHCHWKCTVYFKERIQSFYPFPVTVDNDRVEVVYIDKDHLHAVAGPDQNRQRKMSRDFMGP